MRVWNVVAGLAVTLVLVYLGICAAGWLMGKIDFDAFNKAVLPVILPIVGYLAAFLPKVDAGA